MPIPVETLEKAHQSKITPITDTTSRYSFKFECSCGVQGHFFNELDAIDYETMHRGRKGLGPKVHA